MSAVLRKKKERRRQMLNDLGLTAHDLSSHFFLCGATGSGKTSVLKQLLEGYIEMVAPGALHCCVKADEKVWVSELVERSRMRHRLLLLIPGKFTFNFAAYELSREGGSPGSLTRYLMRLNEQLKQQKGSDSGESFWKGLFQDFLNFAIIIAWLARGKAVTLEHVYQIVTTSPHSVEHATSPEFKESHCWKLLMEAQANVIGKPDQVRSLDRAAEFYLSIQLGLGSKARSAGVQECSSILGFFLLSPFYETFCSPTSSFTPELVLNQVYVVIDAPILVWQEAGQLCQSLIVMMTIDAALRRTDPETHVIIVRDEMQMLVSDPLYETMVHSVARSHGLGFFSCVQNLELLTSAFGGDSRAEQQMKSLLANYVCKFALANGSIDTNQFFSTSFGQHREQLVNLSQQSQSEPQGMLDSMFGTQPFHFGVSESYHERVPPDRFLHLRRGGPPDYAIDAFMTQTGRVFENNLHFKLVTFYQD